MTMYVASVSINTNREKAYYLEMCLLFIGLPGVYRVEIKAGDESLGVCDYTREELIDSLLCFAGSAPIQLTNSDEPSPLP